MKSLAVGLLALASVAPAANLTTFMTVDNFFEIYLSPADPVLGTLVGSGTSWPTTYNFVTALTPAVTNYIHVVAHGAGGIEAFIGDYTLSDASFQFANGTQHLLTNTVDWGFNYTGFGTPYSTPVSDGTNGVGPWGTRPNIDASAQWLDFCSGCTAFFSSPISPVQSGVPEPATFGLLGAGAALLYWRRTRRA
jgi:hypothetical protein